MPEDTECKNPFCPKHGILGQLLEEKNIPVQDMLGIVVVEENKPAPPLPDYEASQIKDSAMKLATELHNEYPGLPIVELVRKQEFRYRLMSRFFASTTAWAHLFAVCSNRLSVAEVFIQVFDEWIDTFIFTWAALDERTH